MLISSVFFPFSFESLNKFCKGSAPTDNTNVNGILLIVSLKTYCIVGEEAFINAYPRVLFMK
jgi:hypothetical protein